MDVIAHELAHSWSGNLVSNASWEHFWLNEGWTTYLERRVSFYHHLLFRSLENTDLCKIEIDLGFNVGSTIGKCC